MNPQNDSVNPLDPALVEHAQKFDDAMQRVFKGIYTRKERRRAMRRSGARAARKQAQDA